MPAAEEKYKKTNILQDKTGFALIARIAVRVIIGATFLTMSFLCKRESGND